MKPEYPQLRRSTRSNKVTYQTTKYINEVFLTEVLNQSHPHYDSQVAYLAELQTDLDTSIVTECDPRAFIAKARKKDKDSPTYNEVIRSAEVY